MLENLYEKPVNLKRRMSLMGHHHLCLLGFEGLREEPEFADAYKAFIDDLGDDPETVIETIYGYDLFCYVCPYWTDEEGRCSTGWVDKIEKDAEVRRLLGVRVGEEHTLEELQRLIATAIDEEKFAELCGPGKFECAWYPLGHCLDGLRKLKKKYCK
jgi:hypothetical protein